MCRLIARSGSIDRCRSAMSQTVLILIAFAFVTSEAVAQNALYNIDFKSDMANSTYNGKGMLGTLQDTVWSRVVSRNTSGIALVNSKGGTSSLTLSSSGITGSWSSLISFAWGVFSDYWLLQNNGSGVITIGGAPSGQQFELLLFCHGPADGRVMRVGVNSSATKETSGKNGGVIQWAMPPDPESNYLQFTGTVPGDGKLTINLTCVGGEADIQGMQIQFGASTVPPKGTITYKLGTDLKAGYDSKVMFVGTSLTDMPYGLSWPTELNAALWNKYQGHMILSNRSVSSTDSRHGMQNIKGWVDSDNPDVVFIEYGINDAIRTPFDTVRSYLDSMVSAILINNPNADIIFQTMNNCTGGSATDRPRLAEYYQLYRDYAAYRGYTLIDNYPIWKALYDTNPTLWATYVSDGIHPDAAGRIASGVIDNMVAGVGSAFPRVAKPVFNVGSTVAISSGTAGAAIYYTIDGKTPTPKSSLYSTPVTVPVNAKIKAIAMKANMTTSVVASAFNTPTGTVTKHVSSSRVDPISFKFEHSMLSIHVSGLNGTPAQILVLDSRGRKVLDARQTDGFVKIGNPTNGLYHLIVKSAGTVSVRHIAVAK